MRRTSFSKQVIADDCSQVDTREIKVTKMKSSHSNGKEDWKLRLRHVRFYDEQIKNVLMNKPGLVTRPLKLPSFLDISSIKCIGIDMSVALFVAW